MAITKEKKAEILKDLVDKFSRSKTVVFSDYRGLDVSSMSDLRGRLREAGSECKVAKKTLMRLAAKESKIEGIGDEVMEGPVAATFCYEDELSGLKVLFKFSKENENLKLLGGIIEGRVVGADEIIKLAKLPSREELIAKMMGSINAPLSGMVGILNNLVGGLVRVLNAYKDTLPADVTSEPVVAEKEESKSETPENTAARSDAVGTQSDEAGAKVDVSTDEGADEKPAAEQTPETTTAEEDTPDTEVKAESSDETAEEEASQGDASAADETSSEEEDDLGEAANDDQETKAKEEAA